MTAMALAAVAVLALSPAAVAEDQDYDVDYGSFYSYTLQFVFSGSNAESIVWDFGDGSTSSEWNPSHTYASTGTYYVTQTTTNSYNGGSTTVEVYKVTILGFPVISFESNGGSEVASIQQTAYNVTATAPADPTRDGYEFAGWYTDSALTTEYDWSSKVKASFTLYAKWTESAVDPDPVDPEDPETVYRTVTFDVAGGSVEVSEQSIVDGKEITLPSYDGTKDGYTFAGWSVGGVVLQPGATVSVTSDMTVTAVWNEASVDPDPVTPTDPEEP
ncbi:MAG: InlB B-repeat-containing protein, partial [Thermoplasmata archaeon]|nr:InlB B-repeat-containing protein [Thermoplasmata archaeon]